jgi:hypothetical protein
MRTKNEVPSMHPNMLRLSVMRSISQHSGRLLNPEPLIPRRAMHVLVIDAMRDTYLPEIADDLDHAQGNYLRLLAMNDDGRSATLYWMLRDGTPLEECMPIS